jgi:uncharacterized protein YcfJ
MLATAMGAAAGVYIGNRMSSSKKNRTAEA